MAKDVKHQVIIDGVVIGERRSPRVYTHAIVADYDRAKHIKQTRLSYCVFAQGKYDHQVKRANAKAGDLVYPGHASLTHYVWKQEEIDESRAFIAANPDRGAYVARLVEEEVVRCCSTPDGTPQVCQWSMSEANAVKGMNHWKKPGYPHRNVRVVPVVRHG